MGTTLASVAANLGYDDIDVSSVITVDDFDANTFAPTPAPTPDPVPSPTASPVASTDDDEWQRAVGDEPELARGVHGCRRGRPALNRHARKRGGLAPGALIIPSQNLRVAGTRRRALLADLLCG